MAVFKDKWNGYKGQSWRVSCYYTDWQGNRKRHEKRGFATKKEAQEYEREFLAGARKDINMSFDTFLNLYMKDVKPRMKANSYETKQSIIDAHIRPYFKNKSLSDISATDILQWQNELLGKRDEQGKAYSLVYLRTIQNHITAAFNHAVKYYDLPKNPCSVNRKMGKDQTKEMLFWTKAEYMRFIEVLKDKPISYYAFQILYWTGVRCGELLALTRKDFDLENKKMTVDESLQVIKGKIVITGPKTVKSNRVIDLPQFLCDEIEDYIESLYKLKDDTRLFPITKSFLHHELDRGCKASGVKRIRLHDLRHSSCALLINLGYSPVQIGERLGHTSVAITERYSHLYPSVQREMADNLNQVFSESDDVGKKG